MKRVPTVPCALLLLAAAAAGCGLSGARVALLEENDVFNIGKGLDVDRDYTQGARFAATLPEADTPRWTKATAEVLPVFDRGAPAHLGVLFGQEIYTPEDRSLVDPPDDDRPYAAWAFLGFAIQSPSLDRDASRRADRLDTVQLDLGVVGPSAQGENAQNRFHELFDIGLANGWNEQIEGEPGLLLTWDRRWRLFAAELGDGPGGLGLDLLPMARGRLGTVRVDATLGTLARLGWDLPRGFGPLAVDCTGLEAGAPPPGPYFFVQAGADLRGVVHDIFLEGGYFEQRHGVTPEPIVWSATLGATAGWGPFSLHFGHTWISPQFKERSRYHQYATILLSATIWF